jgi:hypothetical protein
LLLSSSNLKVGNLSGLPTLNNFKKFLICLVL